MQTDSKHDRCHVNCQQTGSLSCKLAANRVVPCQKSLEKKLYETMIMTGAKDLSSINESMVTIIK